MSLSCVNIEGVPSGAMAEEEEDEGGGVSAGVTLFFVGLAVPVLFNAMTQGQDVISFFVIFTAYAACVVYGEYYLTLISGVSFGAGMIMISFLSFDWWFAALAVSATVFGLARFALSTSPAVGTSVEEDPFEPDPGYYH